MSRTRGACTTLRRTCRTCQTTHAYTVLRSTNCRVRGNTVPSRSACRCFSCRCTSCTSGCRSVRLIRHSICMPCSASLGNVKRETGFGQTGHGRTERTNPSWFGATVARKRHGVGAVPLLPAVGADAMLARAVVAHLAVAPCNELAAFGTVCHELRDGRT